MTKLTKLLLLLILVLFASTRFYYANIYVDNLNFAETYSDTITNTTPVTTNTNDEPLPTTEPSAGDPQPEQGDISEPETQSIETEPTEGEPETEPVTEPEPVLQPTELNLAITDFTNTLNEVFDLFIDFDKMGPLTCFCKDGMFNNELLNSVKASDYKAAKSLAGELKTYLTNFINTKAEKPYSYYMFTNANESDNTINCINTLFDKLENMCDLSKLG